MRLDDAHEPLDVRIRGIALVRRRLDALDRQRGEQQRRAAERIVVSRQHRAPVFLHLAGKSIELGAVGLAGFGGRQPDGRGSDFLAANGFLSRRHDGFTCPERAHEPGESKGLP